ncbi:MAG TPA: hypothetical protein VKB86_08920 [Pyrinomonadaceae bacterium]|nr:hypothetical protein [Pyrinomonadaceae bacterium]
MTPFVSLVVVLLLDLQDNVETSASDAIAHNNALAFIKDKQQARMI